MEQNLSASHSSDNALPTRVNQVVLRPFQPGDEAAFRTLNEEWISEYFTIEPADRFVIDDPVGNVLRQGGHIFFAVDGQTPIGCCALLAMDPGVFELAKMAVAKRCRGKGVGRQLLEYVVAQARKLGAHRLCLETNNRLGNAIHLYESVGFQHLPPERVHASPYARSNVQMEMDLA